MHIQIILAATLACAAAAPALLISHDTHILPVSKSTLTQSSQVVDHGSTYVHHRLVPVVHAHAPLAAKTTITKASQHVNHGGTQVYHAAVPVVHEPVIHVGAKSSQYFHLDTDFHTPVISAPVVHAPVVHAPVVHAPVVHAPLLHAPVVHSSPVYVHSEPLVSVRRSGDSAVSHQSSTVHETESVVKSLPLYAYHH